MVFFNYHVVKNYNIVRKAAPYFIKNGGVVELLVPYRPNIGRVFSKGRTNRGKA
jgi:hypothetical protein